MNEQQATRDGLSFTGIYSHNKDEVKVQAKELREQGYRVVMCNVPSNPLSRSNNGMGYSVYAEKKYFSDQRLISLKKQLSDLPALKATLLAKHKQELIDIEKAYANLLVEIDKLTNI